MINGVKLWCGSVYGGHHSVMWSINGIVIGWFQTSWPGHLCPIVLLPLRMGKYKKMAPERDIRVNQCTRSSSVPRLLWLVFISQGCKWIQSIVRMNRKVPGWKVREYHHYSLPYHNWTCCSSPMNRLWVLQRGVYSKHTRFHFCGKS